MSILFGLYRAERGQIFINGKEVVINNPVQANRLGIGMVHQHFKLVHNFTVTENIVLGMEPRRHLGMNLEHAAKRIREISQRYSLEVDTESRIEDISVGMQQRVEILKMLYRDSDLLILDEPTAVLMPSEIQELIQIMRNLIDENKSIILITHKLKEIKAVANRCTVIRRGKLVGTVDVKSTSLSKMAEMMVGREVSFTVGEKEELSGKEVLNVENVSVKNAQNVLKLKNFSLQVRAGEIMGLAGVDDNGQDELVNVISGLLESVSGRITINGKDITTMNVRERIKSGISHIPGDRQKQGLVLDFSVRDNLVLGICQWPRFSKCGFLDKASIVKNSEEIIRDFDIRNADKGQANASRLSGGNQQKVVVGREISKDPDLLIAVQPTRGLDIGSIEYIHRRIVEQRNAGKAVLLVSLELDEILDLSDRVAVISNGELVGVVEGEGCPGKQSWTYDGWNCSGE